MPNYRGWYQRTGQVLYLLNAPEGIHTLRYQGQNIYLSQTVDTPHIEREGAIVEDFNRISWVDNMPRNNNQSRRWQEQQDARAQQQRTEAQRARTQQAADRGVERAQAQLEREQQATSVIDQLRPLQESYNAAWRNVTINTGSGSRPLTPDEVHPGRDPGSFSIRLQPGSFRGWEDSFNASYAWEPQPAYVSSGAEDGIEVHSISYNPEPIRRNGGGIRQQITEPRPYERLTYEDLEGFLTTLEHPRPAPAINGPVDYHQFYDNYFKTATKAPEAPKEPEWQPEPDVKLSQEEWDNWGF